MPGTKRAEDGPRRACRERRALERRDRLEPLASDRDHRARRGARVGDGDPPSAEVADRDRRGGGAYRAPGGDVERAARERVAAGREEEDRVGQRHGDRRGSRLGRLADGEREDPAVDRSEGAHARRAERRRGASRGRGAASPRPPRRALETRRGGIARAAGRRWRKKDGQVGRSSATIASSRRPGTRSGLHAEEPVLARAARRGLGVLRRARGVTA